MISAKNGHMYLARANNDLVSHCQCADAQITFPPQMGCPWCGCGWLFTCIECRKAFTFARGIWVLESWEATARRDLLGHRAGEPSEGEISSWTDAMKVLLRDVELDENYVCLDGFIIPTSATSIALDGWHSRHNLPFVPQVAALANSNVIEHTIGNRAYWKATAIAE